MRENNIQKHLRTLPSVDGILQQEQVKDLLEKYPRWLVVKTAQRVVDEERKKILSSDPDLIPENTFTTEILSGKVSERISEVGQLSLRSVINATGVIVHTNLGRSLLNQEALQNLMEVILLKYYQVTVFLESKELLTTPHSHLMVRAWYSHQRQDYTMENLKVKVRTTNMLMTMFMLLTLRQRY